MIIHLTVPEVAQGLLGVVALGCGGAVLVAGAALVRAAIKVVRQHWQKRRPPALSYARSRNTSQRLPAQAPVKLAERQSPPRRQTAHID